MGEVSGESRINISCTGILNLLRAFGPHLVAERGDGVLAGIIDEPEHPVRSASCTARGRPHLRQRRRSKNRRSTWGARPRTKMVTGAAAGLAHSGSRRSSCCSGTPGYSSCRQLVGRLAGNWSRAPSRRAAARGGVINEQWLTTVLSSIQGFSAQCRMHEQPWGATVGIRILTSAPCPSSAPAYRKPFSLQTFAAFSQLLVVG